MKTSAPPETLSPTRRKADSGRRLRILLRLAARRLFRSESVELDARGMPKTKPIRWLS